MNALLTLLRFYMIGHSCPYCCGVWGRVAVVPGHVGILCSLIGDYTMSITPPM